MSTPCIGGVRPASDSAPTARCGALVTVFARQLRCHPIQGMTSNVRGVRIDEVLAIDHYSLSEHNNTFGVPRSDVTPQGVKQIGF
jgi:hypothetical protein